MAGCKRFHLRPSPRHLEEVDPPKEIVFDTDLVFWTSLDGVVGGVPKTYHPTFQSACSSAIGKLEGQPVSTSSPTCSYRSKIYQGGVWNGNYSNTVSSIDVKSKHLACPSGTSPTAGGCRVVSVEYEPASQEQFEEELAQKPMPSSVPQELPYPTPASGTTLYQSIPRRKPTISASAGSHRLPHPKAQYKPATVHAALCGHGACAHPVQPLAS